jgi:AraC-like DNA-binding protein
MHIVETCHTPLTGSECDAHHTSLSCARRSLLLEDTFQRAHALIDAMCCDPQLNPMKVARRLGCSRATLYRAFQQRDLTVAGYIQQVRFERVRNSLALAAPRIPISSIAMDCGFECLRHFHRRFKQVFGDTPGAYRVLLRRASKGRDATSLIEK